MKFTQVGALALALSVGLLAPTASARQLLTAKGIKTQCQSMVSCNKGGVQSVVCSIRGEVCPPCVTFENNGCFELVNGACSFGSDCSQYWAEDGSGSSGTSTNKPNAGAKGNHTANNNNNNNNSTAGGAGTSVNSTAATNTTTAPSSDSTAKSGGTDMTVVFGIVGAAIGVIAVAIIFLALVRRSRTSDDEDDVDAATPTGLTKAGSGPGTSTNAGAYAPYAQRAPTNNPSNPTTPTNRVIKYYNDNAMPSPHGGRGGFGAAQPQQPQVKTVRPAAAANAPTFFNKPNAVLAPGTSHMAQTAPPPPPPQAVQAQEPYYTQPPQPPVAAAVPMAAAHAAPAPAEPLFTVHTGAEAPPQQQRRVSSPRPRRESYEF